MRRTVLAVCLLLALSGHAQTTSTWKPQGDKIQTQWATEVSPENALPAYPRPIMMRGEWQNLNGLWQYAICSADALAPSQFEGDILVPYPLESSLSGVMKKLGKGQALWYQRTISIPTEWKGKNILLHFGAIDHEATLYINGTRVTSHKGGYSGFSADITPYLKESGNTLTVKVIDETDDHTQPCGKQRNNPGGPGSIWYTSVSGIWQTVWMEPVNSKHIERLRTTPDLDNNRFIVDVRTVGASVATDKVKVTLMDAGKPVASATSNVGIPVVLPIKKAKLWSPDSPFRYQMAVELISGTTTCDKVDSYAAMRKISSAQDENGVWRLQLNNENLFQFGPLDQGYWPDGLYTAPTDEALLFDVKKTKEWGFNMIRKHMKVEPERWYYFCDSLGIMVWQDMPAIGRGDEGWYMRNWSPLQQHGTHSPEVIATYKQEWQDIIEELYSYPSIVVWTPFNEAWGQFATPEVVEFTRHIDPTRLINSASGGNHYRCGDFLDLHDYSRPPQLYLNDTSRPVVLGEYGGLGRHIEGHRWLETDATTYVNYKDADELTDSYVEQGNAVLKLARGIMLENGEHQAFSAAVYTQTTDVETEVNGLMTYDRRVMKMNEQRLRQINDAISHSLSPRR